MALALAGVVSMRSSMMSEVTRLRSSARRWLVLRPNFFVAMRWRMVGILGDNFMSKATSRWLLAASTKAVSHWHLAVALGSWLSAFASCLLLIPFGRTLG